MKNNLEHLIEELGFNCISGKEHLSRIPKGAYVSDLLSDVMGRAEEGMIWLTSQIHKNIVAVASLKELSAIIIVNERKVDSDVIETAESENVVVLTSETPAFETAGKLYNYLEKADKNKT